MKALESLGYNYNLSVSIINSKGIKDEDEDDEEDLEADAELEGEGEGDEEAKNKEVKVYLDKDTEVAKVLKEALIEKKSNTFTHHKFILDAERDENNELQYDHEVLNDKLHDILNNIQSKFRELTVYNASVGTGINNNIILKDLDPESTPSTYS